MAQWVKHLPSAWVMVPGSWVQAPYQAPLSARSLFLPLPLPTIPQLVFSLCQINKQTNKQNLLKTYSVEDELSMIVTDLRK